MYNFIITHKLKKQIIELENKNKLLIELTNQSKYTIETQKDQINSYANNKTIIKELNRTFSNDIANIIEQKNNEFVLFTNNILQKLDGNLSHDQNKQIEILQKELKTQEQIISHLRSKDLNNMVEKYSEF